MDETGNRTYRWRMATRPLLREPGAVTIGVLLPLAAACAFLLPGLGLLLGLWVLALAATAGRRWLRVWRSVVEVRAEPGGGGRLVLTQRYGRTRTYPLDALTALRPVQVGLVSRVLVEPGEDDERTESDEIELLLELGTRVHGTYRAPHLTTAAVRPLVEALCRACPRAVVAPTEYRMRHAVDVERGMSPG
ncbi:hypothetical protein ABZY31_28655 [Streptomyces sp. NPDC006529]|uniref:hypothetical protein n=1 Tax=Streptomyces sp. NPDC006529 TaxID=3157177 RepID=UPI0033A550D0